MTWRHSTAHEDDAQEETSSPGPVGLAEHRLPAVSALPAGDVTSADPFARRPRGVRSRYSSPCARASCQDARGVEELLRVPGTELSQMHSASVGENDHPSPWNTPSVGDSHRPEGLRPCLNPPIGRQARGFVNPTQYPTRPCTKHPHGRATPLPPPPATSILGVPFPLELTSTRKRPTQQRGKTCLIGNPYLQQLYETPSSGTPSAWRLREIEKPGSGSKTSSCGCPAVTPPSP